MFEIWNTYHNIVQTHFSAFLFNFPKFQIDILVCVDVSYCEKYVKIWSSDLCGTWP